MSRRPSAQEVKSHGLDRLEDILDRLCPGGRRAGGLYTPRNPTRDDRKPGSFVIRLTGAGRGSFVEYTNPNAEKGDLIDLVSYCLTGGALDFKSNQRRGEAIRWIADLCGLEAMPDAQRAAAAEAAHRRQLRTREEAEQLERKRARAWSMWVKGVPPVGTIVEDYLAARGIPLREIANLEADLRCIPSLGYWLDRPARPYPVMAAAMRDGRGNVQAVHFTFLAHDGSGKADVAKPKLIWPAFGGAVIHLTRGASGRTVREADLDGEIETVALSEGIEDGLSIALAAPDLRVWAAASIANIGNVPAPAWIEAWLVHRQNDTSRAAIEQFEQVKRSLEDTGRPVAEIASHHGKDINDLLRGDSAA